MSFVTVSPVEQPTSLMSSDLSGWKPIHWKFRGTLMAPFRNAHSQGLSIDCNWYNISHLICFCLEWKGRGSRRDLLLRSWRRRGHQYVETYLKHLNALQAAVVKLLHLLCCVIFQQGLTTLVLYSSHKRLHFLLSSRAIVGCSISYLCCIHFGYLTVTHCSLSLA